MQPSSGLDEVGIIAEDRCEVAGLFGHTLRVRPSARERFF
jgi:hypothetical protein